MRRRIAACLLLVTAGALGAPRYAAGAGPAPPPPPTGPFPGPIAVAKIYPYEGHQGDPIYVAGRGFRPNTRLIFLLACPSFNDAQALAAHNYILEYGPVTRKDGSFSAYRFKQKLYLKGKSTSSCLLYVDYSDRPASDFPTGYNVVDGSLPPCVRKICSQVHVRSVRLRGRLYERIAVHTLGQAWPGARALISITYPRLRPNVADSAPPSTLAWDGSTTVYIPLREDAPPRIQGTVHVSFRLGPTKGSQYTRFTVRR